MIRPHPLKDIGESEIAKKLDPKIKGRILPTDAQRLQRAYEVKLKTKKSLFDWIADTKSDFLDYDIKKIFLNTPREELLAKIYNRTEQMFKQNCIAEVKKFNAFKLKKIFSALAWSQRARVIAKCLILRLIF